MRVLVLGAGGFVGSHTVAALLDRGDVQVVRGVRRPGPDGGLPVDVLVPQTLAGALDGVDAVVHAVSCTDPDPDLVRAVTVDGTRNLVAACGASRAVRLVSVGTTAVYGTGPHRGAAEGDLPVRPESPVSAARAAAERLVLDAGGNVVRAAPTLGIGDRWFGPALLRGARALGGLPDGGRSRLSVITARALGRALAALAVEPAAAPPPAGRVLHAAHRYAPTVAELLAMLDGGAGAGARIEAIAGERAAARARALGFSPHQLALVSIDHVYDVAALQRLVPGPDAPVLTAAERDWYAGHPAR